MRSGGPRVLRWTSVLALAGALALAPVGAAGAAQAGVDDFAFESFHAEYVLSRGADGHAVLDVTETIVAIFPDVDQNRGFYRDIPEYYQGVRLRTELVSVVDETGAPVPHETEYYQGFFSVALGDDSYVHGRQTYVITYRQHDVVRHFAESGLDEFYWDVNGTGWAQPFGEVSATLTIAPDIAEALNGAVSCYLAGGSCDGAVATEPQDDGSVVVRAAASGLDPGESLTIDVPFEAGTFVPGEPEPAPAWEYTPPPPPPWWAELAPWALMLAGIGIGAAARATHGQSTRGRREGPSDVIVPQYTPPDDVNIMVAAHVIGAPDRAFPAQVVGLAVRGKIRILEHAEDAADPFMLELLDPSGVDVIEAQLIRALFGTDALPGDRVAIRPGDQSLRRKVTDVYRAVEDRLKTDGLRAGARTTVGSGLLIAAGLAVAALALMLMFSSVWDVESGAVMFAVFAAGWGLISALSRQSTYAPLTARGRKVNDHLIGMREYIELAEADRLRMLQSPDAAERVDVNDATQLVKLYERMLPYAILWGLERGWAEELAVKALEASVPVTWVSGSSDFSSWTLRSTLDGVRRAAPAPPRPVVARAVGDRSASRSSWFSGSSGASGSGWSSSGGSSFSSGSSGGGFSGGGGGGGGGRGR